MTTYEYTAKDGNGNTVIGAYDDVNSVAMLRQELAKTGYSLVKAHRRKNQKKKSGRVKRQEVVTFIYKFSEMYSAGLPITRSLEVLEEQSENPALTQIIGDIKHDIENGQSLESAFGKYSHVFSDFFAGMLEAGESGGTLSETLEMSAAYLEKRMDLRRKVRSAFTYPIVVGVVCFVVVGCLLAFVVPIFSKLYKQLHVKLPGPTHALVILSALLRGYWWAILLVAVGAAVLFWRLSKNPAVRARWDEFKLNMPVLGRVNRMIVTSHFTRTFGMLTSVGVSPIRALDVAAVVANNHRMTQVAGELKGVIEKGSSIGSSLRQHDIFPPMIVQLAISGDEVGESAQMLNKGADFLDKDIDRTLNALVVKLEPALTVIMGSIVGFILMAVYLPMFDYMQHLK
ncbi:MAG: type II secretion system F family protein [Phycisphaerales bacterium]|nr:MAG: type II secretion system F family protein [Phycisphaerales bacterium]